MVVRIRPLAAVLTCIAAASFALVAFQGLRADAAIDTEESSFVAVAPQRILDTRDPVDIGLAGPFVSPVAQTLRVTGSVETANGPMVVVPPGATGVVLNVTAINQTADGFVSVVPGDAVGAPTTSNLNFVVGDVVPNTVTVNVPTSGPDEGTIAISYDAYGQAGPTTDLIVDVFGYYTNSALQDLQAQIHALAAGDPGGAIDITGLQAQVATQQETIDVLEAKLSSVFIVEVDGQPTVRFSGVNVQIVNGTGSTGGVPNGRGNLIVGYNAAEPDELRNGSHNVVVGDHHTYTGHGGLVAGYDNKIGATSNSVVGGRNNEATGAYASVTGGLSNKATGEYSAVTAGTQNQATATWAAVSGGSGGTASGNHSSISAGSNGTAGPGSYASISGGGSNIASGAWGSITGGQYNQAIGQYSVVTGGGGPLPANGNQVAGFWNTIVGGDAVTCNSPQRVACGEGALLPGDG